MAFEKSITVSPTVIIGATLCVVSYGLAEIACPNLVVIEKGDTASVSCNITGKTTSVYWYTGNPTFTSPILRLENGKLGGTEYGKGQYNISYDGAMIITNATMSHEGIYTTLVYFHDGTKESRHVNVNISVTPWFSCPTIDVCDPCEECSLFVNETGKLICSVNKVRPRMQLSWKIETENGVSVLQYPPVVAKNSTWDTWNSSIEISYDVSSCDQEATFQCIAEDRFNLLEHPNSSVRIYTANCTDYHSSFDTRTITKVIFILSSAGIFGILMVITLLCILKIRSQTDSTHHNALHEEVQPLVSPKAMDSKAKTLISQLKTTYKAIGAVAAESYEPTDIWEHYVDCQCDIKLTKDEVHVNSTNDLLTSKGIRNERRVLITGYPSYWNVMIVKTFVLNWVQNKQNDFILLYVNKSNVEGNMKLVELLEEKFSIDGDLFASAIERMECILLFDGLNDVLLGESTINKAESERQVEPERSTRNDFLSDLTLTDLFKSGEKLQAHIQIWITSWNEDAIDNIFPWPYVRVYSSDVGKQQFCKFLNKMDTFVEKCEQSLPNNQLCTAKTESDGNIKDFNSGESSGILKNKDAMENQKQVEELGSPRKEGIYLQHFHEILESNQLYEIFKGTPVLLSQIVHIIVQSYLCHKVELRSRSIAQLICEVIAHCQKVNRPKVENGESSQSYNVNGSLGKIAFYLMTTLSPRLDKQIDMVGSRDLNAARQLGFLQYPKGSSECHVLQTDPSKKYLEFSHPYIKYYFTAQYIIQTSTNDTTTLSTFTKGERYFIIDFLIYLEDSCVSTLTESFQESNMDDEFIYCLCKRNNKEEVTNIIDELGKTGREIHITSLDVKQFQQAFALFCEECRDVQVTIKSLSISENFTLSFLQSIELPFIETLTFVKFDVEEKKIICLLQWLSNREMVLRFLECGMPKQWSNEFTSKLKSYNECKVKIVCENCNGVLKLNYKTAKWESETTKVLQKLTAPLTTFKRVANALQ